MSAAGAGAHTATPVTVGMFAMGTLTLALAHLLAAVIVIPTVGRRLARR
jgi:hypothetical protein